MNAVSSLPNERVLDHNLVVIFAITLISVMGVSSIAPIIPMVQEQLGVMREQVGLLITAFTVPGVVLTPLLGIAADRWGRKRVLIPSLLLFAVAGSACALAPSFSVLLALRFAQGAGAAALGSLNVTLIGDLYAGRARATAMGYNGSALSLYTATYPSIGGALALLSWRAPFLLPALGVPVALLALFVLDSPRPPPPARLAAYLRATLRTVRSRAVLALLAASLLTFVLLFGPYLTYMPILLRDRFATSSFFIGLLMSAGSLTTAAISAQLGRLTRRFAPHRLIHVAFVLYALSLALVPLATNPWFLVLPAMLFGAGQGINLPSILTLLAGAAPTEQRGLFMSVNGMVLRVGQSLGPLAMGLAVSAGLDVPFSSGALLALLGAAGLMLVLRPTGKLPP
jgi:predicted MFS family arabinose efflux permease